MTPVGVPTGAIVASGGYVAAMSSELPGPDDASCALPDANIGGRGVARRRTMGTIAGVAAVALLAWLVASSAPRLARLLAAPLVLWCALGLLQAREKT